MWKQDRTEIISECEIFSISSLHPLLPTPTQTRTLPHTPWSIPPQLLCRYSWLSPGNTAQLPQLITEKSPCESVQLSQSGSREKVCHRPLSLPPLHLGPIGIVTHCPIHRRPKHSLLYSFKPYSNAHKLTNWPYIMALCMLWLMRCCLDCDTHKFNYNGIRFALAVRVCVWRACKRACQACVFVRTCMTAWAYVLVHTDAHTYLCTCIFVHKCPWYGCAIQKFVKFVLRMNNVTTVSITMND